MRRLASLAAARASAARAAPSFLISAAGFGGLTLVAVGAGEIYAPLGLIVGGGFMTGAAVLFAGARARAAAPETSKPE